MMIIVSDNTCTGTTVDMLGLDEINAFCHRIGIKNTIHRFGIPTIISRDHTLEEVTTTTPADQGLLLDLILQGTQDANAASRLECTPEIYRLAMDILFQFLLGILGLGIVVNFLSHPVIMGFTNAAVLIIASLQLPKLFGVYKEIDLIAHRIRVARSKIRIYRRQVRKMLFVRVIEGARTGYYLNSDLPENLQTDEQTWRLKVDISNDSAFAVKRCSIWRMGSTVQV
jgi:hypothetical protein